MGANNLKNALAFAGVCLCFGLINAASDTPCPGPQSYYKDVGCTPVYETPESKCPKKYDCDHLKNLPTDKCYVNGHTYEIGEALRQEDANPCDVECVCSSGTGKAPAFVCASVNCAFPTTPGCYRKQKASECCAGEEVCPKNDEDRATCVVDGEVYRDGEWFQPRSEPEKSCYCGEGYAGKNVEPFCASPKSSWCGTWLYFSDSIRQNCIPTYYPTESPRTGCSIEYRCPNTYDAVVPTAMSRPTDPEMQCKFGALMMNVGDELTQPSAENNACMRCVCEVAPVPTCTRLSDEECASVRDPKYGVF